MITPLRNQLSDHYDTSDFLVVNILLPGSQKIYGRLKFNPRFFATGEFPPAETSLLKFPPTIKMPSPNKKQCCAAPNTCCSSCRCDQRAAIVEGIIGNRMREEGELQAQVWRDQMVTYRDANILLNQRLRAMQTRLRRAVTANRIIIHTNQSVRNMNNTLSDLLHEIFEMDPAMARFYRDRIRFPDMDYSDDDASTDGEDDEGGLELIRQVEHIEELEAEARNE